MQQSAMITASERSLRWLASMRLTQVLLGMLGIATLVSYFARGVDTLAVGVPLGLLVANLVAAVLTNAVFRRQPALMAFHLALVAIVALLGLSQLYALNGRFELTEGVAYDGSMMAGSRGPLAAPLVDASFVHEGFTIEYGPGLRRGNTHNPVHWLDERGVERRAVIGDHKPLALGPYRFYTTGNKGFAPLFEWRSEGAAPERGAVHLPSYPLHESGQIRQWRPAGSSSALTVELQLPPRLLDYEKAFVLGRPARHSVVVRAGDAQAELQPGESAALAGGVVRYLGLRTWMGYRVTYDVLSPWLLAAALVAVASLCWHFVAKFRRRPW